MEIVINGNTFEIENAPTVTEALERARISTEQGGIAVAVNNHVVPRSQWSECVLRPHDRIEVIHAVQGG
jgi:sulfur carrier protein